MATYFVSDLHLFARRSTANRHVDSLHAAANRAETFVFGGDIFDFKWSPWPTVAETVSAARCWLEEFVRSHPHCRFHYVVGNHDSNPLFTEALDSLSGSESNFAWRPDWLRLGENVFLHGDVTDGHLDSDSLAASRERWNESRPKGRFENWLYDAVVALRLHRVPIIWFHPPQRVVTRIVSYLDHIGQNGAAGVKRIYFGHTHAALDAFTHAGLRFFNGGAAIRGLRFRIVEVEEGPDRG